MGKLNLTNQERQYMLEEFSNSRERWTDLQIQTINRNGDTLQKISEREFQLMLSLATISVGFITIVVPLTQKHISVFSLALFNLSLVYFFACALVGIVYLLWLIYHDRKYFKENRNWEMEQLKIFQNRANTIYDKLRTKEDITEEEVKAYFDQDISLKKGFKDRENKLNRKISTRILNLLHGLFFGFFAAGFICLFLFLYL